VRKNVKINHKQTKELLSIWSFKDASIRKFNVENQSKLKNQERLPAF
jgi:hypothetical protein